VHRLDAAIRMESMNLQGGWVTCGRTEGRACMRGVLSIETFGRLKRVYNTSSTIACSYQHEGGLTLEGSSPVPDGLSDNVGASWSAASCTPVEIPVSSLGHLFRFPMFERTCLARHTVPREEIFTGLYGRGSG
jgi:hypothetical protein